MFILYVDMFILWNRRDNNSYDVQIRRIVAM